MASNTHSTTRGASALRSLLRPELLLVAVFAAIAGASLMRSSSAPAAEPVKVATVDLEKTFNSLKRYEAEQAKVKLVGETLNKQVKDAEARVRELESEMESFKEGSKEQADAISKLQAAVGELRAVQQFANAKLELEKARALRETYFAIKDAVRRFAEKEGYDYMV